MEEELEKKKQEVAVKEKEVEVSRGKQPSLRRQILC